MREGSVVVLAAGNYTGISMIVVFHSLNCTFQTSTTNQSRLANIVAIDADGSLVLITTPQADARTLST